MLFTGICTLQDCDISFRTIRVARLLRDLDFARYEFYNRTGIYERSRELSITSLQGSTYTLTSEPVPLFQIYKINTKVISKFKFRIYFINNSVTINCYSTCIYVNALMNEIDMHKHNKLTL